MTVGGRRFDLLGFGEVLVLFQAAAGESLGVAREVALHVAGAEFNACAAASRLGAKTALCTRLGADPLADQVRSRARECDVAIVAVADADRPTGLFLKDVRPDGDRHVYYYRSTSAASAMGEADADRGLATEPRVVLLSGLTSALGDGPRQMAERVAATARQRRIRVALDVNLRPQLGRLSDSIDSVRRMLPSVEFLIVGVDDAKALFGEDAPDRITAAARTAGCAEVVITAGPNGSWWQDENGTMIHQETLASTIADPVGAGDAFAGAYLAGRLAGLSRRSSCWLGSAFAAAVIAAPGDTAGLPSASRAREMLHQATQLEELNA